MRGGHPSHRRCCSPRSTAPSRCEIEALCNMSSVFTLRNIIAIFFVFSPPPKPPPMNRCRTYRLMNPLTGIWPAYGERPDTMFFFHNSIKKNGVICLLLLLKVCLLSSCKTNNVVKAKIATINNECIRNVVDNMLSYADSITETTTKSK